MAGYRLRFLSVIFQTEAVTFELLDSAGTTDLRGSTKYYAGGWHTFENGTTPTSMQLLPANYKFCVTHAGAKQEKWQHVGVDPAVIFHTEVGNIQAVSK